MSRFHAIHFGCRANQADGAAVEEELSQRGFEAVKDFREAELVVLNSCTVTATADAELRQTVRRIHRENPQARILVTGCYAQRRPEELAALPGIRWVVGNSHKNVIGRLVSADCQETGEPSQWVPLERLLVPSSAAAAIEFHTVGSPLPQNEMEYAPQVIVGDIFAAQQFSSAPVFGKTAGERTRPNLKI